MISSLKMEREDLGVSEKSAASNNSPTVPGILWRAVPVTRDSFSVSRRRALRMSLGAEGLS